MISPLLSIFPPRLRNCGPTQRQPCRRTVHHQNTALYKLMDWLLSSSPTHPIWGTIVICANIGLESVQHIIIDLALLSPGVAGPGQVVGHVIGIHLRQDGQGMVSGRSSLASVSVNRKLKFLGADQILQLHFCFSQILVNMFLLKASFLIYYFNLPFYSFN